MAIGLEVSLPAVVNVSIQPAIWKIQQAAQPRRAGREARNSMSCSCVSGNGIFQSTVAPVKAWEVKRTRSPTSVVVASFSNGSFEPDMCSMEKVRFSDSVKRLACGLCAALTVATAAFPSIAASGEQRARLPPLSNDPTRCEKAFDGNTIGQANGVANIILDLRFCDYTNDVTNLKGKTLSAALMANAKFDGADLSDVIMSKAYAVGASFVGTNFKNAVVDRVTFDKSDMRGVQFINTVLSGSTFQGANLENASFEDALIGYVDIKKLCLNTTLSDDNKVELGCK